MVKRLFLIAFAAAALAAVTCGDGGKFGGGTGGG